MSAEDPIDDPGRVSIGLDQAAIESLKQFTKSIDKLQTIMSGGNVSALQKLFKAGGGSGGSDKSGGSVGNAANIAGLVSKQIGLGQMAFLTKIGGAGLVIGALQAMRESSPQLGAVVKLFEASTRLFLMPIGNVLGRFLMPLAIYALKYFRDVKGAENAIAEYFRLKTYEEKGLMEWLFTGPQGQHGSNFSDPLTNFFLPPAGAAGDEYFTKDGMLSETANPSGVTPYQGPSGMGHDYWAHVYDVVESLDDGEDSMELLSNIFKMMVSEDGVSMSDDIAQMAAYMEQAERMGLDTKTSLYNIASIFDIAYGELVAKIKKWLSSAAAAKAAAQAQGKSGGAAKAEMRAAQSALYVWDQAGYDPTGTGEDTLRNLNAGNVWLKKEAETVANDYSVNAWVNAKKRVGEDALKAEAQKAAAAYPGYSNYANPNFATGGASKTTASQQNTALNQLAALTGGLIGQTSSAYLGNSIMQQAYAELDRINQAAGQNISNRNTSYGNYANPGYEWDGVGWREKTAYAEGGWINEPIAGIGLRTGGKYTFGEAGRELVVPGGRMGGSNFSITINIGKVDKTADFEQLKPMIQRWILEANSRRGIL